jgi:hypothetical protein
MLKTDEMGTVCDTCVRKRNSWKFVVNKPEVKISLARSRNRWKKKCFVVFTGPTFLCELFKPVVHERDYTERPTASCRNRLYLLNVILKK